MDAPAHAACWSCAKAIDPLDHFCRHCGMGQGAHLAWYYQPIWIVTLALLAAGPMVLPLVWKTPKLSTKGRWGFTVFLALLTLWLIKGFYNAVQMLQTVLATASGGAL
jgi:hypothetical protein